MPLSYAETSVKGKPLERVGRKVTGLRSVRTEYDRRAPGVRSSSVVSVQFARAHLPRDCAYAAHHDCTYTSPFRFLLPHNASLAYPSSACPQCARGGATAAGGGTPPDLRVVLAWHAD